jgi:hypothetical protein
VILNSYNAVTERYAGVADGRTDEMGRFQISTYARFDGAPVGEYVVTVVKADAVPAAYSAAATTPLKVVVKEIPNTVDLDLPARE